MASATRATLAGSVPTIIVREVLKYTMPNLVMSKLVVDANKWAGTAQYGDTIQIPSHLTRLGVTQLPTGLGGQGAEDSPPSISYTAPTTGNVQVLIDQWWYSAFQMTVYADAVAGLVDWKTILKQSEADSLAVKIDATLTNLLDGFSTVRGTDNVGLRFQDLQGAMTDLDGVDAPQEDRQYVISTGEKGNLLTLEFITNQLYRGAAMNPLTKGQLGNPVLGATVHVTTNLTAGASGKKSGYFQTNALAVAMRRQPFTLTLTNPNSASDEVAMFAIWGIKELRDNHGVELDGL